MITIFPKGLLNSSFRRGLIGAAECTHGRKLFRFKDKISIGISRGKTVYLALDVSQLALNAELSVGFCRLTMGPPGAHLLEKGKHCSLVGIQYKNIKTRVV